ncbi:MAG: cytochrome c [Verrucomicrobia bacterium]|nr:cytochrome c [Verrucomicrobiota bacterium]
MRRTLCAIALAGSLTLGHAAISQDEVAYLFNKECASCHGKDGKARTPVGRKLGAKDLKESKVSDAEIEKQILEGKKAKDGGYTMPAFKEKLDPDEIKALIAFIKKFRQ